MWPELRSSMKQTNKKSLLVEAGSFAGVGIGSSERCNRMLLVRCDAEIEGGPQCPCPSVVPLVPFYRVQQIMNGGVESMVNSIDFSEMLFPCSCSGRSNSFVRSSRQSQQMHFLL